MTAEEIAALNTGSPILIDAKFQFVETGEIVVVNIGSGLDTTRVMIHAEQIHVADVRDERALQAGDLVDDCGARIETLKIIALHGESAWVEKGSMSYVRDLRYLRRVL